MQRTIVPVRDGDVSLGYLAEGVTSFVVEVASDGTVTMRPMDDPEPVMAHGRPGTDVPDWIREHQAAIDLLRRRD